MKRLLIALLMVSIMGQAFPADATVDAIHSDNIRVVGEAPAVTWIHRATFRKDLLFAAHAYETKKGFDVYRLGDSGEPTIKRISTFPCWSNNEGTIAHWRNFVFQALESPVG